MPTADACDTWTATVRHVAAESRCFVLSCNQYSTKSMYPEEITSRDEFKNLPEEMSRGGSCIAGPLGELIVEPMYGEETILLDQIVESQFDFDVSGHYSRPDVFQLSVNEREQKTAVWKE